MMRPPSHFEWKLTALSPNPLPMNAVGIFMKTKPETYLSTSPWSKAAFSSKQFIKHQNSPYTDVDNTYKRTAASAHKNVFFGI